MLSRNEETELQANLIKTFAYKVEDLTAGSDISARPIWEDPTNSIYIESIGILTEGSPAGVDDSNTAVISVLNGSNAIVTATYNTASQPPSSDYASLGTLSATYRSVSPATLIKLTVTNGTTANLPAFQVLIRYRITG